MPPRIAFALIAVLLLLPGFWTVSRTPTLDRSHAITATRIVIPQRRVGQVTVEEAWRLTSPNSFFGSYSAMAVTPDRRFTLVSDAGMVARLTLSSTGVVSDASIRELPLRPGTERRKTLMDSESLTVDPATGQMWVGFEYDTRIARYAPDLSRFEGETRPPALRHWPRGRGPEAMTRLPDGRLLVFAEKPPEGAERFNAVLFPVDPVAHTRTPSTAFDYDRADRGPVVDASALPDGRVLILHRRFSLWDHWDCILVVADSAAIRPGRPWQGREIARFAAPGLVDNFEGIAARADPRGGYTLWMVSDDNRMVWQETLLLRMHWPG